MKIRALIGSALVLVSLATAKADHFELTYPPSPVWADYYGSLNIDGRSAQADDEIAAFVRDGGSGEDICIGAFKVPDRPDYPKGSYGFLHTYGDDYTTNDVLDEDGNLIVDWNRNGEFDFLKDGAFAGDEVRFRVWDASEGMELNAYPVTAWTGNYDRINVDVRTMPEPSSLLLLGTGVLALNRKRFIEHKL